MLHQSMVSGFPECGKTIYAARKLGHLREAQRRHGSMGTLSNLLGL